MSTTSGAKKRSGGGGGGTGGAGAAADEEEDSESESSSSSSSSGTLTPDLSENLEVALEEFRDKWKTEVRVRKDEDNGNLASGGSVTDVEHDCDIVTKARDLFLAGVELERAGELFSAVQKYKKAVQMVPDIEYRVFDEVRTKSCAAGTNPISGDKGDDDVELLVDDRDVDVALLDEGAEKDLIGKFTSLKISQAVGTEIEMEVEQEWSKHISCLPMEILIAILKWVVSDQLDLKSLEKCSAVCNCFYVASRSPDLWRIISLNMWGANALPLDAGCWRTYFLSRPRVLLDGCYIAKISYAREGERGFQDQFYHPWHVVRYFRYLRFFVGGHMVMLTSAEEPIGGVKILKRKPMNGQHISGVMVGHYRIVDDKIIGVMKTQKSASTTNSAPRFGKRRRNSLFTQYVPEQEFHYEFQVRGRRHNQLHWMRYQIVRLGSNGGEDTRTDLDISNGQTFPTLHFSRVKSYTIESENSLM